MTNSNDERRRRLAVALKDNIKRRKAQAHAQAQIQTLQTSAEKEKSMQPTKSVGILSGDVPLSEGINTGDLIFLSGQLGLIPGTGKLNNANFEAEATQVMDNIAAILKANDRDFSHVVKCLVMLVDMADWPAFNAVYTRYFSKPFPARSAFGVTALAMGAKVEVECIVSAK